MKEGILKERLKEIIKIAYKLKWIYPPNKTPKRTSYPLMQLSEVEKCMIAMVDDFELGRMREWLKDVETGKHFPKYEHEYYEEKRRKTR